VRTVKNFNVKESVAFNCLSALGCSVWLAQVNSTCSPSTHLLFTLAVYDASVLIDKAIAEMNTKSLMNSKYFFLALHVLMAACAYGWAYCEQQFLQIISDLVCTGNAQLYGGLSQGMLVMTLLLWGILILMTCRRWKRVHHDHEGRSLLLPVLSSLAPPVYFLFIGYGFVSPSVNCL
jgi:hypothetical protein